MRSRAGGDEAPPSAARGMLLRFLLGAVVLMVLGGTATATGLVLAVDQVARDIPEIPGPPLKTEPTKPGRPQTLLLLGSDRRWADLKKNNPKLERNEPVRSDTMMLVRMDSNAGVTSVLSLPRDLRVAIPGVGLRKLNDAYAEGGPKLTLETVELLTGLKIHHVVNVNFGGFRRAVNQVGCIYADVDRRYFHSNVGVPVGQRYDAIDIKPGYQQLCGTDALDYVRHRHADSDLVRAARQQDFLRAAKDQLSTSRLLGDRGELIDIFTASTQTDANLASTRGLLRLLKLAIFSADRPVRQIAFPASFVKERDEQAEANVEYVDASPAAIDKAVDRFLHPPREEGRAARDPERASGASGGRRRSSGRRARRRRPSLSRSIRSARLVEALGPAQRITRALRRRLPFPLAVPRARTEPSHYADARTYTLKDRAGRPHRAYRLVAEHSRINGSYYGVQGTDWREPPALAHPTEVRRVGNRTLELFRSGTRLRYVAWRTDRAVYWVSNSLTLDLRNDQMLTIARSLTSRRSSR